MPIALRHREDPTPPLTPLDGLRVRLERRASTMAALQGRAESEIRARFDAGHRAYVASLEGIPAAWGWVATSSATIGELQASFSMPAGERYLWNFVTLEPFRGRGIYPLLLEAIVRAESASAERFWIAYAPENHASGAGMRKAGFGLVAELSFDLGGRPVVKDIVPGGGATAARIVGLPEIREPVAPCWKCVHAGKPAAMACAEGHCSCDYQHRETPCAS